MSPYALKVGNSNIDNAVSHDLFSFYFFGIYGSISVQVQTRKQMPLCIPRDISLKQEIGGLPIH